jgi:hypothetical protein
MGNPPEALRDQMFTKIRNYLGTEHTYMEYKPMKESTEYTIYVKIHGTNFRLDWEFSDHDLTTDGVDACFQTFRKQAAEDITDLWKAGPDWNAMQAALAAPREDS